MKLVYTLLFLSCSGLFWAQEWDDKFKQIDNLLPTPNVYRTASGAPGHQYYQQKADYKIKLELDDEQQIIRGEEVITYTNNSPDPLEYLWLQLDQNVRAQHSHSKLISVDNMASFKGINNLERKMFEFDGGFKIEWIKSMNNEDLNYAINQTMLRIDPKTPLKPGGTLTFKVKWWYNINDRMKVGGRSGYEYFEEEDNYLYTIAQFFPRMCVYDDVNGWQNKQFLGRGEFTLPFGDYEVEITVPADHVVAATGELQNASSVLTSQQRERLKKAAEAYDKPVFIITDKEAEENEKGKASGKKKWIFKAQNVRDFAFASSRKFIWDAMTVKQENKNVLAMSFYPKEGNPLWEKYSTRIVAHTLNVYSNYTFDYPYPVAISVHSRHIGMEYPMICFNGGRPEPDGTYSERVKYGMLTVIIHEVGHNYFPMIVNSDERQWTWMDEGLNTFLQYLTEQEWERGYPSRRGPAHKITDYMAGDKSTLSPIMTNSESIWQFGNNAYGKPATALNILRETIMGRELFDYAFKTYARRWMFKHPTPADFFRTMEDASAVDLDWFWRGWFFTTDHVDIGISNVKWYTLNTENPEVESEWRRTHDQQQDVHVGDIRNQSDIEETQTEKYPELNDFYNLKDPYAISPLDTEEYNELLSQLTPEQEKLLNSNLNFYELEFENIGGLVMPLILQLNYTDGTSEVRYIPAEIWRFKSDVITKVFIIEKEVKHFRLDPFLETADTELSNNSWPREVRQSRFQLFREKQLQENEMQRDKRAKEMK
ncbi:M1 family metallopeptidase [Wandonia haliotis]|uniref:M1 family metallopeptidase n=1 Tax=Wandonia haliotis TaxID=574963 RepID=A0ABP3Y3H9_9FLAO